MQKWEYLFVRSAFAQPRNRNDPLRPHFINGQELRDWERGPTIYEFANQMGEQGWELVSFSYQGEYPQPSMVFKRPKE